MFLKEFHKILLRRHILKCYILFYDFISVKDLFITKVGVNYIVGRNFFLSFSSLIELTHSSEDKVLTITTGVERMQNAFLLDSRRNTLPRPFYYSFPVYSQPHPSLSPPSLLFSVETPNEFF